MNINRHNYEEFFLLYVDNELSAAARKAVDVFVLENPDLQGELLQLQKTVSKADEVKLEKKDWLYMEEDISALQENLLLYADDELNISDKRAVEALLATDKAASAEWNILRQTKLQPDTSIRFEDKRSLYRTEKGRVVGFKWWRAAAAAVFLGIGLWGGLSVYNNNFKTSSAGKGKVAGGSGLKPGQANPVENKTMIAAEANSEKNSTASSIPVATVPKNQDENKTENIKLSSERIVKENNLESKDNVAALKEKINNKQGNNLPKRPLENINNKERNLYAVTNVTPESSNNMNVSGTTNVIVKTSPKDKTTNPVVAGINNSNTDPNTAAAIPVVYNNTVDENNNDRFLYMDEEKVKRTMLGGFIRKAKRVLERTANIKTGDGIKVAGFEIALK